MTAIAGDNRLDEEESPYLRGHADNPVNWQPWDDHAMETARERDVPIFLSVGYAACHWCHVMADESFDDEEVAAMLNDSFVSIKVDREERPDVDSIYQTICQQVSGRGGWPLSVWLTPDGRPFQVGTYFPKEPRRGMPGFLDLLESISDAWNDPQEREKIEQRADQWHAAVKGELEEVPDDGEQPGEGILEQAAQAAARGADRQHGGWGSGPKFPQTGRLHLLARAYDRTDRDVYREILTESLDAMANGGMYDHVGGGFHRYATDRDWTVPHFEKMLYDNAELPRVYLGGYRLTGEKRYAEVVEETLEFVTRELTHPEGGFYSTLDAQSERDGEREEGAFYVWTPEEVHEAVDDETAASLFCERFGVTERGNFEGRTVLTRAQSVETIADGRDESVEEIETLLSEAMAQVTTARENRPRPPRDEKILAGWNGLMISAFAEAAVVLDDSYADPAVAALEFVRDHLWDGESLSRRYADGVVKIDGYLEDYAFLARAALNVFEATRDPTHLAFAFSLARAIEREFWDSETETLYFTPSEGETLIARPQELMDQSTPSSAGVAAETLDILGHFVDDSFSDIAEAVIETHGSRIRSNPLQHASLTLAADTVTEGVLELTLVADGISDAWREEFATRYLHPSVLAWRPPEDEELEQWMETLEMADAPRLWENRTQKNNEPTVYACRGRTCSPPRNEMNRALNWAERML